MKAKKRRSERPIVLNPPQALSFNTKSQTYDPRISWNKSENRPRRRAACSKSKLQSKLHAPDNFFFRRESDHARPQKEQKVDPQAAPKDQEREFASKRIGRRVRLQFETILEAKSEEKK